MGFIVGIVDTMFARYDMAKDVINVLEEYTGVIKYYRYTVPGIKDLPVGCKKLFIEQKCDLILALGMPGPVEYDKVSAKTASEGLMLVQVEFGKHILEVFVHEDEGIGSSLDGSIDKDRLSNVMSRRAESHARNAVNLLVDPKKLEDKAGTGVRQGYPDAGSIKW